ncbi:MAG: hypothetical protein IT536_06135 [Hyphomicrobiales bacterium]|nr:hypothetical protein [Hyphomicrobiales bacterium]
MHRKLAILVGLTVVGLACAVTLATSAAWAQSAPSLPKATAPSAVAPGIAPGVSPAEVLRIVRASGLTPLTQPARRGATYLVLASDNMGGQLRVTIGATNGRILKAAPAHDPRFAHDRVRPPVAVPRAGTSQPPVATAPPPAVSQPPSRIARPVPPAPTGSAPESRPARAPDRGAGEAAPVPRPRPAIAASETAPSTPPVAQAPTAQPAVPKPPAPAAPAAKPPATQLVPVAPLD